MVEFTEVKMEMLSLGDEIQVPMSSLIDTTAKSQVV